MRIFDNMTPRGGSEELCGAVFAAGSAPAAAHAQAAQEHFAAVYLNDKLVMRLVCTPGLLAEMVLGRLYTEGFISGTAEVESISVCEAGTQVRVQLNHAIAFDEEYVELTASCCTGNHLLKSVFGGAGVPQPVRPAFWRPEWIYALARYFEAGEGTPLFAANRSVHSAVLAREDKILFCCEDIGRHNAADKAIGCALRAGVDLTQCIMFSSGRLPTDMVAKVIRAGIPVLCSKAACTDEAARLAGEFGLALITRARSTSFTLELPPEPERLPPVPELSEAERRAAGENFCALDLTDAASRTPQALLALDRERFYGVSAAVRCDAEQAVSFLLRAGYRARLAR